MPDAPNRSREWSGSRSSSDTPAATAPGATAPLGQPVRASGVESAGEPASLLPRVLSFLDGGRERIRRLEASHADLTRQVERLREQDRLKTAFLANVSHELRTPLALILGPVDRALRNAHLSDAVRHDLTLIQRNSRVLARQVDQLLDIARLDAGAARPEYAAVDVAHLVRDAIASFEALAASRGIDVGVEAPETMYAQVDARLLERMVLNLTANAFRFTPARGTIRLRLEADGPNDERMVLHVDDSGPGVPPDQREHIFARFAQGDPDQARPGGVGLGLAITREFARLHRGDASVADSPLGGARFTLTLPRTAPAEERGIEPSPPDPTELEEDARRALATFPPPEAAPASTVDRGPHDARPRVLIVEDNIGMRAYLVDVLSSDFRVAAYARADEAVEVARRRPPDLVISDVSRRDEDGDVLDRLRADDALRTVPVLLLTGRAEPEFRADLLRRGADDYVLKPVPDTELLARVRHLTDLKHSRETLERELATNSQNLSTLAMEAALRNRELERTIQEKQTLLQEVHHRVKGNLQTVTSLLNLRARRVEDPVARRVLEESVSRVRVMALLHETLYRSGDPAHVDLAEYLRAVLAHLFSSQGIDRSRLVLDTSEALRPADLETAIPLGLLVHELVANALRHAFPAGRTGNVRVALASDSAGLLTLEVQDQGVGLPEGMEMGTTSSMGLQLVHALADQLGGALEIERDGGTRFRLRFRALEEVGA